MTFSPRFRLALLPLLSAGSVAVAALSADEQALVRYVDAHQAGYAATLERAVLIDSATENTEGVKRVGALYRTEFESLGFTTRWAEMPAEMKRAGHLFAERTGTHGRRLLLIGHLDTVLHAKEFRRDGNRAFGAGVNDMKGGNLVVMEALRALASIGALDGTRIIASFTGDEESAGEPLELARRDLIGAAKRSDAALAFETAIGDTVTTGRRGSSLWTLEVQGATGHSAGIFSAYAGSGSVFEASRILTAFYEQLRQEPGLTFNPAIIVGGTEAAITEDHTHGTAAGKGNVIAQRTLVRGDLRFADPAQLERARGVMRTIVGTGQLPRTSATIAFQDHYPAMAPTAGNLALLTELDVVSRELGFAKVEAYDPNLRGAGDVSFVAPILPCLDGLGARGKGAHAPTEEIDLASLPELVKRTAILIYRLTR